MSLPVTAPSSAGYKVLFVNFSPMTSSLLQEAIEKHHSIEVAGAAQHMAAAHALLQLHLPRIVVVGSRPGKEQPTGLPFVEQINAAAPGTRQVVLGQEVSEADEIAFLRSGARGLLNERDTTISMLAKCLDCVAAGQVWANSAQLERLLLSLSRPVTFRVTNTLGAPILSKREDEVLCLLAEGLSNRDLAATLKLSEHTVKNHLFRIFDKLGVSSRMEAVLYAMNQREFPANHVPLSCSAESAGSTTIADSYRIAGASPRSVQSASAV